MTFYIKKTTYIHTVFMWMLGNGIIQIMNEILDAV